VLPPITTKQMLWDYLLEASMLEQQFMCQYLYAAFSIKKDVDATCNEAQFESVRRWASTLYMIARQEMEHLSAVTSILTATGGAPYLGHLNFPTQAPQLRSQALTAKRRDGDPPPCDMPFYLAPFSLSTVRRFCCMEAPHLDDVAPDMRAAMLAWCYQDAGGNCPCVAPATAPAPMKSRLAVPPYDVDSGTIQDLYAAIDAGLVTLVDQLGDAAVFDGHCSGQSEIPSEYMIFLFPICDLRSARAAIRMVVEQGEGLDAPPVPSSHVQLFYDMAVEYAALLAADPAFDPAKPVPLDPKWRGYDDPTVALASETFHYGYFSLLCMLTGYYAYYSKAQFAKYPYLSAALEQSAFAPMMTMLIRSLAEVMTMMPIPGGVAAPSFDLEHDEDGFLGNWRDPSYADIAFYLNQANATVARLQLLAEQIADPTLRGKVTFIFQNVSRVAANLSYNYQKGIYPRFDPDDSGKWTCPPSGGCDCE
jgi:hypothetical protein